ncbi:MAG: ferrous iron transport protein B, partial [Candidatus Hadarchaeales archaeon]
IFHRITGADVIVSNYPGTTVELTEAKVHHDNLLIKIIDLPGTYSLGALTEDELVARRVILEQNPDVVMNIVDASNLERSLFLTLQLLALNRPMIVVLNMYDEALKKGIRPDPKLLSKALGVPVIPTVATTGKNVHKAFELAIKVAMSRKKPGKTMRMGWDMERAIKELEANVRKIFKPTPFRLPARTVAVRLLEGDVHIIEEVAKLPNSEKVLKKAGALAREIARKHGEPAAFRIAKERHALAASISKKVTRYEKKEISRMEKLDMILTSPKTGVPILVGVFALLLLFLIYVGGWLESLLVDLWATHVSPGLSGFFKSFGAVGEVLNIGINNGIQGILAVMLPYIFTFFVVLAILEDTGYLTRMAFVMDSLMHKIGLHGRAVVPMLGGFGCNVPAIMGTRVLATKRERVIASFLITMIPCSARTAVILGTVGAFLGLKPALVIYATILLLIFAVGWLLNRWLPGKVTGMIMEMPPLRRPTPKAVLMKTWIRMKHFVYMAIPLLLLGSLLIGALQISGVMEAIVNPLSPLTTGLLGLPAAAIIPLIYGFIRKEGALVLLVSLAGTSNLLVFMTPLQLFVFALVTAIYIPCIATVAVLRRELGWKDAGAISAGTFLLAVLVGGLFFHLNPLGL